MTSALARQAPAQSLADRRLPPVAEIAVASIALIVWSVDEIVRGVNPWRRILGSGVLAWVVIGVVLS